MDVSNIQESLDEIILKCNSTQNQLKSKFERLQGYNDTKYRIINWITTSEEAFSGMNDTKGDICEMKTLLERLKHIQNEITLKHTDLQHLSMEAKELYTPEKFAKESEEINNLKLKCDQLSNICSSHLKNLEIEIDDYLSYYQNLQEIEKWLLQISFQLMAHNSLYISNREQTIEQIAQHEELLNTIQKYQKKIDDLGDKGHQQIDRYKSNAPGLEQKIELQLKNIQESYDSLLHTSIQIKNRLCDSLAKFQEYEDTLDSIILKLNDYEEIVNVEINTHESNFGKVQSQLQKMKVIIKFFCNYCKTLTLIFL